MAYRPSSLSDSQNDPVSSLTYTISAEAETATGRAFSRQFVVGGLLMMVGVLWTVITALDAWYWRWNPDPIVCNNVIYTAFFGFMLGLYETLTDDAVFSLPNALPLSWKQGQVFNYVFNLVAQALRRNMLARSDSPQYRCEPHLIYPMCNTFAFNTLIMHDRLHDTELTGDLVERVRDPYHRGVEGASQPTELKADSQGHAVIPLSLQHRVELNIVPVL